MALGGDGLNVFCGIQLKAIPQKLINLTHNMCSEITLLELLQQGANDLW